LVDTTRQALLRKAAELAGRDELARRLNPDRKMLPLADLLEQLSDRLK
jgi:hypothetical protein